MKVVLWIVGLFALAVGLSLFAQINTGYAIVFVPPYRVELSLNMTLLLAVGLIAVSYGLLRLLAATLNLPHEVAVFQRRKKLRIARHALVQSSLAYSEGRFQKAEREALRACENEQSPENQGVALLLAARAAHAMRAYDRRDGYLARMDSLGNGLQLARRMLEAELLLDEKRTVDALAAVEAARAQSPNLTAALRLELKIRQLQSSPEHVLALTEKLLKSEAISAEQARRYRLAAYRDQLPQLIDGQELRQWWQRIPAQERQNPSLALAVAQQYAKLEQADDAAHLLQGLLEDDYSSELVGELGELADQVSEARRIELLRLGEALLPSHSRDAQLLLTLGRLARAGKLWGKAQSYFEASLSIQPTLAAHAELARLLQALDRADEARRHFDACLELALAEV